MSNKVIKQIPDEIVEGWGLTSNDENLIISDGTVNIFFLDENIKIVRNITVFFYVYNRSMILFLIIITLMN